MVRNSSLIEENCALLLPSTQNNVTVSPCQTKQVKLDLCLEAAVILTVSLGLSLTVQDFGNTFFEVFLGL